jgi:hypothetical protein
MGSYLRMGGEEVDLVGGRLMWQRGTCMGRRGIVFHVAAHGRRRMLHLSGWAPADRVEDLSGQTVKLEASGPDAAVDGRFFATAAIRFGRVVPARAILSIDGDVESMDLSSDGLSPVEADVACAVEGVALRRFCLGCGRNVEGFARDRDDYVGGYRVRVSVVPVLCPDCDGVADAPRYCPVCGTAYGDGEVYALGDDASLGYTATCSEGHTFSGQLTG